MSTVKSLIKKASKYSDSGVAKGKDVPPTPADRAMTIQHTADSVEYNLPHAYDHLDELLKQLSRLCEYDPGKAKALAKKVCAKLDPLLDKIEKHKEY